MSELGVLSNCRRFAQSRIPPCNEDRSIRFPQKWYANDTRGASDNRYQPEDPVIVQAGRDEASSDRALNANSVSDPDRLRLKKPETYHDGADEWSEGVNPHGCSSIFFPEEVGDGSRANG